MAICGSLDGPELLLQVLRLLSGKLWRRGTCRHTCVPDALRNNSQYSAVTLNGSARTGNAIAAFVRISCRWVDVIGTVLDYTVGPKPSPNSHQHLGAHPSCVQSLHSQAAVSDFVVREWKEAGKLVFKRGRCMECMTYNQDMKHALYV